MCIHIITRYINNDFFSFLKATGLSETINFDLAQMGYKGNGF
ncbi:hypothetical protein CsSME_00031276 [Camellia sinensis var. sinensis]